METFQTKINNLTSHVEDYIKTKEELAKLIAAEKSGMVAGELFSSFVLLLVFSTAFLFLSFSGAYFIAEITGKTYLGFVSMTGFYLLLGVLFYTNRQSWLKNPVMNSVIKNFFKGENHEQN
jgi:hypothetical protein